MERESGKEVHGKDHGKTHRKEVNLIKGKLHLARKKKKSRVTRPSIAGNKKKKKYSGTIVKKTHSKTAKQPKCNTIWEKNPQSKKSPKGSERDLVSTSPCLHHTVSVPKIWSNSENELAVCQHKAAVQPRSYRLLFGEFTSPQRCVELMMCRMCLSEQPFFLGTIFGVGRFSSLNFWTSTIKSTGCEYVCSWQVH